MEPTPPLFDPPTPENFLEWAKAANDRHRLRQIDWQRGAGLASPILWRLERDGGLPRKATVDAAFRYVEQLDAAREGRPARIEPPVIPGVLPAPPVEECVQVHPERSVAERLLDRLVNRCGEAEVVRHLVVLDLAVPCRRQSSRGKSRSPGRS